MISLYESLKGRLFGVTVRFRGLRVSGLRVLDLG